MKTIPKLVGFEYIKVQSLTREQKDLALEAFGYALAEHNKIEKGEVPSELIETFSSFIDRGLIL